MITLNDIISRAKIEVSYFNSDSDYWWEVAANESVREFGCSDILVKCNECIKLDQNGRWFFPKNFYQLIGFAGQQIINNNTTPTFSPIIYWEQPILQMANIGTNVSNLNAAVMSVQRNRNYFQFFGNTSTFINLTVAYLSYNTDEHGSFYILEDFEQPIMFYLCAQWALRHSKDYSQWQYQTWIDWYYRLKRKVVSERNQVLFKNTRPQLIIACNNLISHCQGGGGIAGAGSLF